MYKKYKKLDHNTNDIIVLKDIMDKLKSFILDICSLGVPNSNYSNSVDYVNLSDNAKKYYDLTPEVANFNVQDGDIFPSFSISSYIANNTPVYYIKYAWMKQPMLIFISDKIKRISSSYNYLNFGNTYDVPSICVSFSCDIFSSEENNHYTEHRIFKSMSSSDKIDPQYAYGTYEDATVYASPIMFLCCNRSLNYRDNFILSLHNHVFSFIEYDKLLVQSHYFITPLSDCKVPNHDIVGDVVVNGHLIFKCYDNLLSCNGEDPTDSLLYILNANIDHRCYNDIAYHVGADLGQSGHDFLLNHQYWVCSLYRNNEKRAIKKPFTYRLPDTDPNKYVGKAEISTDSAGNFGLSVKHSYVNSNDILSNNKYPIVPALDHISDEYKYTNYPSFSNNTLNNHNSFFPLLVYTARDSSANKSDRDVSLFCVLPTLFYYDNLYDSDFRPCELCVDGNIYITYRNYTAAYGHHNVGILVG